MSRPSTFLIMIDADGCVRGSAYPSAADDLAEGMKPGWRIEQVGRNEWERRAEPCLRGACEHRGGAR